MKYVYPAIFQHEGENHAGEKAYSIFFPDIEKGATCGDGLIHAMEMAMDFLCGAMHDIEESKETVPNPSDINLLIDGLSHDSFATLIIADTEEYRKTLARINNR